MAVQIRLSWPGGSRVLDAPGPLSIGRHPMSDVVLDHPAVSGRHAQVVFDGGTWVFRDLGSTNGSWDAGQRLVAPVPLTGERRLLLGRPDRGVELTLTPMPAAVPAPVAPPMPPYAGAPQAPPMLPPQSAPPQSAPPQSVPPYAAPAQPVPAQSAPPYAAAAPPGPPAPALVVHHQGVDHRFPAGTSVVIGRGPTAQLRLDNGTVSAEHARLDFDPATGVWVYTDSSTNGTWRDGARVAGPMPVTEPVALYLGRPGDGVQVQLRPEGTGSAAAVGAPAGAPLGAPMPPMPPTPPVAGGMPQLERGPVMRRQPGDDMTIPVGVEAAGQELRVTVGGSTVPLAAVLGEPYVIGRDDKARITSANGYVSREHLRLMWTGNRWEAVDLSTRGTYDSAGQQVPRGVPWPVLTRVTLRLGDRNAGETVKLTPPGMPVEEPVPFWKKPAAYIAAVALVAVSGLGFALTRRTGDAVLDLDVVRPSVVRLTMVDAKGQKIGVGSGTIVSSDGLILTNAHVGAPDAPGLSAQYGAGSKEEPISHVIVGITTEADKPAQDTYRAKALVADGYVDLAVLKIEAKADGQPLPGALNLPALPLAPDDSMQTGDELTVLGFPGIAESDAITVTKGVMNAYVKDPHLNSDRAFLESGAEIRHGNSGGTAVDGQGRLVGVPTRLKDNTLGDQSKRARPVKFARPLIDIAKKGGDKSYFSPYLVRPSGSEKATDFGVSRPTISSCKEALGSSQVPVSSQTVVAFEMTGAEGVDRYITVHVLAVDGRPGQIIGGGTPSQYTKEKPCSAVTVARALPPGKYAAILWVGPDAEKVVEAKEFTVGAG